MRTTELEVIESHQVGDWLAELYEADGPDSTHQSHRVTVKYKNVVWIRSTGRMVYLNAKEEIERLDAIEYVPKKTGKCGADRDASARITSTLKAGEKQSPELLEGLV